MNAADPLSQLKDIHTPPPIGWWPLAPLWWVIIAVSAIALLTLSMFLWRLYKQRHYRKLALQELQQLEKQKDWPPQAFLQAINRLVKRVAIHAYGESCATLNGHAWLEFLDTTVKKPEAAFTQGSGAVLGNALYQPNPHFDQPALNSLVKHWLKHHLRCPHRKGEPQHV